MNLISKQTAVEKAAALVERLTAENAANLSALQVAEEAHSDALLDSPGGDQAKSERKALERARAKAEDSAIALRKAESRLRSAIALEKLADQSWRWDRALTVAGERQRALESVTAVAETFAKQWAEVLRLNSELYAALPYIEDIDGALLRAQDLEVLLREELRRLGLDWAITSLIAKVDTPTMLHKIEQLPDLFRRWRDKNVGA